MKILIVEDEKLLAESVEDLLTARGFESNAVENHVEVYVGFLRKKLRSIGSHVRIEAARRLGYHPEVDGE